MNMYSMAFRGTDEEDYSDDQSYNKENNNTEREFFNGSYNSEDENRDMEEDLYCEMYFAANENEVLDQEKESSSKHRVGDQNESELPSMTSMENETNISNEEKKRKRSLSKHDIGKESSPKKRSRKKLKKIDQNVSDKEVSVSTPASNRLHVEDDKLTPVVSCEITNSVDLTETDLEISVGFDNEENVTDFAEDSQKKRQTEKKKNKKKEAATEVISDSEDAISISEDVISISGASSESSVILDDSSDDDLDIHLDKSYTSTPGDSHLQTILNNLSECDWKVNKTDKFGSSFSGKSRYYNSASRIRCWNCNQQGHPTFKCSEPKKEKACILCGNRGHLSRSCSQSICYRCNRPGHSARECERRRIAREDSCRRCRMFGHYKTECPDIWRQYHLTTGSDKIVSGAKLENHRQFCYNCAASGHFGHDCKKPRSDHYTNATLPFVAKYDKNEMKMKTPSTQTKHEHNSTPKSVKKMLVHPSSNDRTDQSCQEIYGLESNRGHGAEEYFETEVGLQDSLPNKNKKQVKSLLTSDQLNNFAQRINNKIAEKRRKASKKKLIKDQQMKEMQLESESTLPSQIDGNLHASVQETRHFQHMSNSFNSIFGSHYKSFSNHSKFEEQHGGDFPRSNTKTWKKFEDPFEIQGRFKDPSYSADRSGNSSFDTPKDIKSNIIKYFRQRNALIRTSTPKTLLNKDEWQNGKFVGINNHEDLDDSQLLAEFYGKKHMRNVKRKEFRKNKRTEKKREKRKLAAAEKSLLSKSENNQIIKKDESGRQIHETEGGFCVTISQ